MKCHAVTPKISKPRQSSVTKYARYWSHVSTATSDGRQAKKLRPVHSPPKNAREKKEKLKKKESQCEKQSAVLQTLAKNL